MLIHTLPTTQAMDEMRKAIKALALLHKSTSEALNEDMKSYEKSTTVQPGEKKKPVQPERGPQATWHQWRWINSIHHPLLHKASSPSSDPSDDPTHARKRCEDANTALIKALRAVEDNLILAENEVFAGDLVMLCISK
jgi:hypothetical protein